ncbi:MAG: MFS transporter [Deltaproteobacteria bacterium]|nr:MFS transporter [Deltaproteobacteria bacterium]
MLAITRRVAWTSAVIHGVVHAQVMLLPAVLGDLKREFSVDVLRLMVAANLMYLAFGMAAIPAGFLADRIGSRRMLSIASLGCTTALVAIGVAPTFGWLTVALVALGFSAGIYHPSGLSMLSRAVHPDERGRAIGIHGAGGNLGEALAPTVAALLAAQFGWRYGFLTVAGLSLCCGALVLTLPARFGASSCPAPHPAPTVRNLGHALRMLWAHASLRWLLLSSIAGGLVYRGVVTFLPLHLGNAYHGSFILSLVLLCGIAAQRIGGELADRMPRRTAVSRERLFFFQTLLFVPLLLLLTTLTGSGLIIAALGFGFLWYLAQPLGATLVAQYANEHDHGLLFGVQFASTFGVGSLATTLGGFLTLQGGTRLAFLGFASVAVVQLLAAMALMRVTAAQHKSSQKPLLAKTG